MLLHIFIYKYFWKLNLVLEIEPFQYFKYFFILLHNAIWYYVEWEWKESLFQIMYDKNHKSFMEKPRH